MLWLKCLNEIEDGSHREVSLQSDGRRRIVFREGQHCQGKI